MIKIYSKLDVLLYEASRYAYSGVFMGECHMTVEVNSPKPIPFDLGDYVIYRNERFELNNRPTTRKQAKTGSYGAAYVYDSLKFDSLSHELVRCDFLDVVQADNQIHFSGTGTFDFYASNALDLVNRIKANLDRLYKEDKSWILVVSPDAELTKDNSVSVDNTSCWNALGLLQEQFDLSFTIKGRVITIGAASVDVGRVFGYGKGNGLLDIEERAEDNSTLVTRLRVFGSRRNMDDSYYNKLRDSSGQAYISEMFYAPELRLPSFPYITSDAFIDSDNIAEYGIREGVLKFDSEDNEIYPTMEGMTSDDLLKAGVSVWLPHGDNGHLDEILSADNPEDDGVLKVGEELPATFKIRLKDIGFDLSEKDEDGQYKYSTTETMQIVMRSGKNIARVFDVIENGIAKVSDEGLYAYELTLNRHVENGIDMAFPNANWQLQSGDRYVILGISMPEVYVKAASQRLLVSGQEAIAKLSKTSKTYTPTIDRVFMARHELIGESIKEGMTFSFDDEDLDIESTIALQNLRITHNDNDIPSYEITLSDERIQTTIDKIQSSINASSASGGGGGLSITRVKELIEAMGLRSFLSKTKPDTAKGKITFAAGAEFGNYASGIHVGRGGKIDDKGHAELESLILRSFLEVPEIRYNRLTLIGEEIAIGAGGIIEEVYITEVEGSGIIPELKYKIKLKLEEGEFNPFQPADIVKGIYNQGGAFNTSWFSINTVSEDGLYMDIIVPDGSQVFNGRNYPPKQFMNIARWGNFNDITRQTVMILSAKTGNIVIHDGVDGYMNSKGEKAGYVNSLWGKPEGLEFLDEYEDLNPHDSVLYARTLLYQDLRKIDYKGRVVKEYIDRGIWSLATATNDPYQSTSSLQDEVWHKAEKFRCIKHETKAEPNSKSPDWVMILSIKEEIDESRGSKTFFAKPSMYRKGDRWILTEDMQLLDNFYLKGQILEATYATNSDSDWRLMLIEGDEEVTEAINLIRNYTFKEGAKHWESIEGAIVGMGDEIPTDYYTPSINVLGDEYGYEYAITTENDELIILDE